MDMTTLHRALHRLASMHGHEWAMHVTEDECASDWDAAAAKATAAMDEAKADLRRRGLSMPGGVYPDTAHTTMTGRLSWAVGPGDALHIRVDRPSPIGGYAVVQTRISWPGDGAVPVWRLIIDARLGPGAHLRHLAAMHAAVYTAIGSPLSYDSAVPSAISRAELHADGSWLDDEFRGGSAAELAARIGSESELAANVGRFRSPYWDVRY